MDIAQELLNGNRLALTRAITAIENETDAAVEIMKNCIHILGMPLSLVLLAHQVQVNPLLPIDSQELIVIRENSWYYSY